MDCYITNRYIEEKDIFVITTKKEVYDRFVSNGCKAVLIDEYLYLDSQKIYDLLMTISKDFIFCEEMNDTDRLLFSITSGGCGGLETESLTNIDSGFN